MERNKKNVIETPDGSNSIASQEDSVELRNKLIPTEYSGDYTNPPIPKGYNHICGEWDNGFVIQRFSDGSQFVWIPVGILDSNGTLGKDIKNLNDELLEQLESVKKYGGFYISRYNISKSSEGKPQSVKGVMPWHKLDFDDAKKVAASIEDNEAVKSHLTFSVEYDTVLEWFIKTGVKTFYEIANDSTEWGNYYNTENSPMDVVETGSREEWCVNNIYDLAGNVDEWTQESDCDEYYVVRGGFCLDNGYDNPAAYRCLIDHGRIYFAGFRASLYLA